MAAPPCGPVWLYRPTDRRLPACLPPPAPPPQVVSDWVGLRPGRTHLRLEVDRTSSGSGSGSGSGGGSGSGNIGTSGGGAAAPLVVHNYGHGGAGLTLAWGCAGEVVRLLQAEGVL